MKSIKIILCFIAVFSSSISFAEGDGGAVETGNYTTTALAALESGGTGYASYKKYSTANDVREASRRFILKPEDGKARSLSSNQVKQLQDEVQVGEEHRFFYHRGPEENKLLHLENKWDEVEDKRSEASSYRSRAHSARFRTRRICTARDRQGTCTSHRRVPAPDYIAAARYDRLAAEADTAAEKLKIEYTFMKGRPASSFSPIKLEKVFDVGDDGVEKTKAFISDMTNEGGKFYQSSEISAKAVAEGKKLKLAGLGLGVLAAGGAVLSMEELFYGAASHALFDDERETASSEWNFFDNDSSSVPTTYSATSVSKY